MVCPPDSLNARRDPAEWLRTEFTIRSSRHPRFTLRAFARTLGIPSGRLSEILSRKRRITLQLGERMVQQLDFSPQQANDFLAAIKLENENGRGGKAEVHTSRPLMHRLAADKFAMISEWHYFAFLSLVETDDFDSSPSWCANRLGISEQEVSQTIERLLRLGMIKWDKAGQLRCTHNFITTEDVPSTALRQSHRETMVQAMNALDEIPVQLREITSVTLSTSPKKLALAKEAIRKFRDDLIALLEDGEKTEVFNLNIQFIPVTKTRLP